MRIVLVPSAFWPSVGGVEEVTRHLAHELSADNDVEIWTSRSSAPGRPSVDEFEGLRVRRFDFWLPPARPGPAFRFPLRASAAARELRRAVGEFRPDLLHVVCFGPNGAYATGLSRFASIPLVVTLAGETFMDDHDIYERSVLLRSALRWGVRRAASVSACSQFALNDALRFGLRPGQGEVIFNAITTDAVVEKTLDRPFARYVLGIGRIVHKKGFDLLIEAFARIAPTRKDVGLVIGGDGSELVALRRLAAELGLSERIHFAGPLTRAEVAGAMRDASVFVMPSRVEPFGIVALEAWRAGTPLIVSSRGGAPEFVRDGIDGIVADPFDTDSLADALLTLLDDGPRASLLATEGSARLPAFSWQVITESYYQSYLKATGT